VDNLNLCRTDDIHKHAVHTNHRQTSTVLDSLFIHRIAEVFMSENSPSLKEDVIHHFVEKDHVTRIVFCTEAFGMGLDCPNIHQVIHFSPPKGMETYVQAVGRGGRDGIQSTALIINASTHAPVDTDIRRYINSKDTCRRVSIFEHSMGTSINCPSKECECCDICALKCECGQCCIHNLIIQ
jgi:ATP-dependent DNA helicase RecQ